MKVRPIFAWYDLWVGVFWDTSKRRLYVLPLPCIGLVFEFGERRVSPSPSQSYGCKHLTKRYPTFGRWRCMDCGAEGDLPFVPEERP